ncbi:MAG: ankyrin repeat domain-containing protein [Planctomycetota bacterium]
MKPLAPKNLAFTKLIVVATVLFVLVASVSLIVYIRRTDIHGAISSGDTAALKAMLDRRPDLIEERGDMGATPLHTAAEQGHAEIMKLLIERGMDPSQADWIARSPLHVAAAKGHAEAVAALLEGGAKHSPGNHQSDTPLHLAADAGHVDVVRILIEAGADINDKDYRNQTPLDRARDRGRKKVVELLLKHGAKTNKD